MADGGWKSIVAKLLGLPTMPTQALEGGGRVEPNDYLGGQITPPVLSQTRWVLRDLETAIHQADMGDLSTAARLWRSMRGDGVLSGVLSTSTDGLVRLPVRWSGGDEMVREFEGRDRKRGVFASMYPSPELALLAGDGIGLGIGVGQMLKVPTESDAPPMYVLRRLEPEFLRYRWHEDRWYYQSIAGPLPITPGVPREDGGWWILHRPGGELTPWMHGLWKTLGRAFIAKEHAILHRENYSAKLAQAARVAKAPLAATEEQRMGFLQKIIQWGVNQAFVLTPGWDIGLVESNGRGYEVFQATIATSDNEFIVSIAGQTVTTDGGSGFVNGDMFKSVRADLIQARGDSLALTINEQGTLPYVNERWGAGALEEAPAMEWDTAPPKEMKAHADSITAVGLAITTVNAAVAPYGHRVDVHEITTRFGIPLEGIEQPVVQPSESSPEGGEDAGPVGGPELAPVTVPQLGPGTGNGEKFAENVRQIRGAAVQAILFDRDDWEPEDARAWARSNGYAVDATRTHDHTLAIEQLPAARFERGSIRRVHIKEGVEAIVGTLRALRLAATSESGAKVRNYSGITVIIDRPKGYHQRGSDETGAAWDRVYAVDYGYLAGTRGGDGEELDAFCGPDRWAPTAWVATQVDDEGCFDEWKLFLGFASEHEARACYLAHIPHRFLSDMFELPVEMLRGLLGLEPRARKVALVRALERSAA